jgi:nucleotide-binding universal stress UspA family protein
MAQLHTVVCPVDFSAATGRQVELAAGVCGTFGARLILHHHISVLSSGLAVGWMWAADHQLESGDAVVAELRALQVALPRTLAIEAQVTRGPSSAHSVREVCRSADADLVVLSTHGATSDDHPSLTEQLLGSARCGVLVLHEPAIDARTLSFEAPPGAAQAIVVASDLRAGSQGAVDLACELVRRLPATLHLVHVIEHHGSGAIADTVRADAERRLKALVPDDLAGRSHVHVCQGDAARCIVEEAARLSAACIVMGEHSKAPLRRWLSRDTSRALLHRASCPLWYVPANASARTGAGVAAESAILDAPA